MQTNALERSSNFYLMPKLILIIISLCLNFYFIVHLSVSKSVFSLLSYLTWIVHSHFKNKYIFSILRSIEVGVYFTFITWATNCYVSLSELALTANSDFGSYYHNQLFQTKIPPRYHSYLCKIRDLILPVVWISMIHATTCMQLSLFFC